MYINQQFGQKFLLTNKQFQQFLVKVATTSMSNERQQMFKQQVLALLEQ